MHRRKVNTTKRIFLHKNKHRRSKIYRGGIGPHTQELNQNPNYPAVYGIDNKTVLYPISKYGVPAGGFDPPVNSNGPDGNGPINGPYLGMGGRRSRRMRTKRMRSKRMRTKRMRIRSKSIRSKSIRSKSMRSKSMHSKSNGKKRFRGGGNPSTLLPQTIVNAGRGVMETVYDTANGFSGHTNNASLNYMPYNQPIDQDVKYLRTDFPNVAKDYNDSDIIVSQYF